MRDGDEAIHLRPDCYGIVRAFVRAVGQKLYDVGICTMDDDKERQI